MQAQILKDFGGDGHPLVYVPGIDGTGELLLGTAERLAQQFRVVTLHYIWDGELGDDPYRTLADSIAACLRAAEVPPTLLLAESFGVAVALTVALQHPDLVTGLALCNGFDYYEGRARLALSRTLAPFLPSFVFRTSRRLFAVSAFIRPRKDPVAEQEFAARRDREFDRGYRQRLRMLRGLDLRERLGDVKQPVALFASDCDRVVSSVRTFKRMASALPDATLEIIPRAGHMVLPLRDEPWSERLGSLQRRTTQPGV